MVCRLLGKAPRLSVAESHPTAIGVAGWPFSLTPKAGLIRMLAQSLREAPQRVLTNLSLQKRALTLRRECFMKTNESVLDRVLRVLLGLAVGAYFLATQHPAWALVGVIPLATGVVGFCPLYRLLGWSTSAVTPKPRASA